MAPGSRPGAALSRGSELPLRGDSACRGGCGRRLRAELRQLVLLRREPRSRAPVPVARGRLSGKALPVIYWPAPWEPDQLLNVPLSRSPSAVTDLARGGRGSGDRRLSRKWSFQEAGLTLRGPWPMGGELGCRTRQRPFLKEQAPGWPVPCPPGVPSSGASGRLCQPGQLCLCFCAWALVCLHVAVSSP